MLFFYSKHAKGEEKTFSRVPIANITKTFVVNLMGRNVYHFEARRKHNSTFSFSEADFPNLMLEDLVTAGRVMQLLVRTRGKRTVSFGALKKIKYYLGFVLWDFARADIEVASWVKTVPPPDPRIHSEVLVYINSGIVDAPELAVVLPLSSDARQRILVRESEKNLHSTTYLRWILEHADALAGPTEPKKELMHDGGKSEVVFGSQRSSVQNYSAHALC